MEKQIKNGIIHIHSEHSLKDSAAKLDAICKRASELGAPAIALTDHGTLTGTYDFVEAAKKYNIKPIPGCEVYYEEDDSLLRRAHALIIPKDIVGFTAMSKVVTESNSRLDSLDIPRVNLEILRKYFGEGTQGHGHAFFTSACMSGILSSILLSNNYIQKDIDKVEKRMKKLYNPNSPAYISNLEKVEDIERQVTQITDEINELTKIAKKPFKKKEKALDALLGSEEYAERKTVLDKEKEESANAERRVEELKELRKKLKAQQKKIKDYCKNEEKDHDKWRAYEAKIAELSKALVSESELRKEAKEQASVFESIFGKGNFYIELQNHRIDEEKYVMPILAKIAEELDIPVVATNDAHMVYNSDDELKARQLMRSLRFNKWDEMFEGDKELYIKSDEELSNILSEILPSSIVEKAMNGIGDILASCNVEFKTENHYPKFTSPVNGETSENYLRRLSNEGIEWRYPNREGWTEKHQERMEYELRVIKELDVCDYLCIVEDFLRYGRLLGKLDMNNPDPRYLADPYNIELLKEITRDNVGLGIGPGRGSAVGSLVCYLIGITGIDPMKYNLIFERFLNTERVTMPDIDSDFKPDIRNKVLDYVKYKYGDAAVCCIMTRGTQQAKAAIRNAARLLGSELYDDTKTFLSLGDEIAKSVPKELNIKLDDCWDVLVEKFNTNKHAMEILNNAKLIEGTFTNVGMHAAGVIIADNGDVKEYVPLMYIPGTKQFATQCDKDRAESLGMLKMDFLGLRNLGIITETLKIIKQKFGKNINIEEVPMDPNVFREIFSKGATNSVFQFESNGMKQMLRQFKPESIEDIILLVAAYRPGPMQFLDSVIAVKHGRKKPEYVIPEMASVLDTTYGSPIYQEQIMTIFNKFAGFSLGESDIIRRYMSKKKTDKFMAYKDKFIDGLVKSGADPEKAEAFWTQLLDFSQYAFNKSHAAAYAFVAYYTAWLKYHYPKEYLCAVMNDTEFDKLSGLINDCKDFGISVLPPDINESDSLFSIENDSIVFGLGNVKNVGNAGDPIIQERRINGPFTSFANFMLRTKCKKDVAESLILAGAFDKFSESRSALKSSVTEYGDILKKISTKKEKLITVNADIEKLEYNKNVYGLSDKENKELEKINASKCKLTDSLNELYSNINSIAVNVHGEENGFVRLQEEKELLGAYVSGHPLDAYKKPEELKCTPIGELSEKRFASIMGIISNLRLTNRKSDNAGMAFFTIEDVTGSVNVCCFTKAFKEYSHLIKEDAVIQIDGKCFEDEDSMTEEVVLKFSVDSIKPLTENRPVIKLYVPSIMAWTNDIYPKIKPYQDKNGYDLIIYDCLFGKFRNTNLTISKDILNNNLGFKVSI